MAVWHFSISCEDKWAALAAMTADSVVYDALFVDFLITFDFMVTHAASVSRFCRRQFWVFSVAILLVFSRICCSSCSSLPLLRHVW